MPPWGAQQPLGHQEGPHLGREWCDSAASVSASVNSSSEPAYGGLDHQALTLASARRSASSRGKHPWCSMIPALSSR